MKTSPWLKTASSILLAGLLSASALAPAEAQSRRRGASTPPAASVDIPYEKFQLDNGLTVIVHEDRKAPVVAVSVWYKVGSKDEPEGQTGFAHLFEHLMFNGSENYDDEWFKPLQEVGATGLNGTTNTDRTNYFQTVPTPALDRILWLESDRMGHFIGAVTQDKLDEQRGVVQNEKRQGENQPYGRVFGHMLENLFPPGHPYSHSVIGSMDDLNAASLEDVREWFDAYYGPSNAVVVLAGDIDASTAREKMNTYFGDIEAGPPVEKFDSWVPRRNAPTKQIIQDQVPQSRIYRVWAVPQDTDPVSNDLFIAANILGDGKNSRLYKDLVYDREIATDAGVFSLELQMASIFGVFVDIKPGENVADVENAVDSVLAEFLEDGPTREEVSLVSTKTIASTIRGLEQVGGFGGKAVTLAQGELYAGDPGFFKKELDLLGKATPAKVLAASKAWLGDNYHQITYVPFPDYKTSSAGVDRSTGMPAVAGETALSFPAIEEATLANGMKVVLAQRDTIPVVNVAVQFDAGYAADAGGKLGLANFTTSMLEEGAGRLDALGFSAALEKLGSTISAGSNLDTTTVRLSALKNNLQPSLSLLSDMIRKPTFEADAIERTRKQLLAGIAQEKANPTAIALRLLPPLMFGEGHAYGIPLTGSGDEAAVASITRDELVGFKDQWMRPDNGTIFVVGDTTMAVVKPLLERSFGGWRAGGEKPTKNIANVNLPDTPRVVLVDRPGSPQSFILAGHVAPPTGVDNNIAISAMNEIVGGGFNSRMNTNLREDKGWSYGARTVLVGAKGQRPFVLLAPVQTDKTGASIAEIKKEFTDFFGDRPASAQELERVKLDNVRSLPGQFETSGAVLGSLLSSARFNRPTNYPATLPEKYSALDVPQISEAAAQVLRPDQLIWVIIGDASKIEEEIRNAGIGEVEVKALTDL
ncbi:MAG: pitrilysin family protein [Pseudomonadota bacterium]